MAKAKVEVIFIKRSDEACGFTVLGNFSVDGDGPVLPNLTIPSIGERIVVNLPDKNFQGRIVDKSTIYSQKDMAEKDWDLVTRTILTLELDLEDGPGFHVAKG